MEPSHALSDAVLTLVGLFVFIIYLKPLPYRERLLWSLFMLSITAAAFFGTIRFLGYPQAKTISEFFQHFAGTAGAMGLFLAVYLSRKKVTLAPKYLVAILSITIVVFLWAHLGQKQFILKGASLVAIPAVLGVGIAEFLRTKKNKHAWLIFGICILILANFSGNIAKILRVDAINCYHYLVALSLPFFGKAASREPSGSTPYDNQ